MGVMGHAACPQQLYAVGSGPLIEGRRDRLFNRLL